MSRLSLTLLGPFSAMLDSAPCAAFHSDKARALLAVLAVDCARPLRRESLAGLLWPGYPERSARASLSQALHALNRLAGPSPAGAAPLIAATRAALQLNCAACDIDVLAFSTLLEEAQRHRHRDGELCVPCADRLQRALALYTGDLLEGFSLRDSPEFDEWHLVARERYRRLALWAAQTLVDWGESQGGGDAALASARRWTELDPLDEQAQRSLIGLLARDGQRSAALAQYDAFRRMLRTALGIEPEEATRALVERVRAHDPSLEPEAATGATLQPADEPAPLARASPVPRHNLPAAVDSFVGRERELGQVRDLLCDPAVRLVTLVGAGGMGKTRLALEVARASLDDFAEGVWFVDLAPLPGTQLAAMPLAEELGQTASDDRVVRAIAAVLEVDAEAAPDLPARIILALQDRALLMVMDNCEHVLGGAVPALARLLSACPMLTVLATCREPLRIAGEHLYQVGPLDVPADASELDPGDALRGYSAIQLLAERAAAARYGATIDRENLDPAVAICQRLDGMPLAIELAAARLSALSMVDVAAALEAGGATDRHREERWALLS
ncbi:MAG: AfsR/SARP family transcriptional regulator, partial [Anaerolineae bacterium]